MIMKTGYRLENGIDYVLKYRNNINYSITYTCI